MKLVPFTTSAPVSYKNPINRYHHIHIRIIVIINFIFIFLILQVLLIAVPPFAFHVACPMMAADTSKIVVQAPIVIHTALSAPFCRLFALTNRIVTPHSFVRLEFPYSFINFISTFVTFFFFSQCLFLFKHVDGMEAGTIL